MSPYSRIFLGGLALGLTGLIVGCASSTPESRIQKDQATFAALPPDAQGKIRSGQIEVGFNGAMVHLALGQPDRIFSRGTDRGPEEVWVYRDHRAQWSFGLGLGGGGGSTSVGTGVGVSTGGSRGDRYQVTFQNGVVTVIQSRTH